MQRELKLTYRDRFNLYSRTFQITYLAFLSATLFIKPGYDTVAEGQNFLLEIFFAALVSIFAGFGKVCFTIHVHIVIFRHKVSCLSVLCTALPSLAEIGKDATDT